MQITPILPIIPIAKTTNRQNYSQDRQKFHQLLQKAKEHSESETNSQLFATAMLAKQ